MSVPSGFEAKPRYRGRIAIGLAMAGCGLAFLALPSTSSAAVTIGADVNATANTSVGTCNGIFSCTWAQTDPSTAGPVQQVRSPIDGVIVRWRVFGAGTLQLQVITSADGDNASASATSDPAALLNGQPNATRLPIHANQLIGIAMPDIGSNSVDRHSESGYGTVRRWQPALTGATDASFSQQPDASLLLNADVEPDADADGYGDETQDLCFTDASTQGPCLGGTTEPDTTITRGPPAKTRKRGATFEFAASEPDSKFQCKLDGSQFNNCGSPFKLLKVKKGTHTFQVRAKDTAGTVDSTPASLTWTVKKKKRRK
ncbi:MAG TPA: hypothetical protein VEK39_04745 [Solirubrobacterales bacterium]|nr:hypothetical protein [Solirubrobacterales bacterium]